MARSGKVAPLPDSSSSALSVRRTGWDGSDTQPLLSQSASQPLKDEGGKEADRKGNDDKDEDDKTPSKRRPSLFLKVPVPATFGSQVLWSRDGLNTNDGYLAITLAFKKKEIFIQTTILLGVVLLAAFINDLYFFFGLQTTSITSKWLLSILILHSVAVYTWLLSFIYANAAGDLKNLKISMGVGAFQFLLFSLRVTFEFLTVSYKPTMFINVQ